MKDTSSALAVPSGAKALVTTCPFCVRILADGAKLLESSLEIVTLESLVAGLVVA